MSKRLHVSKLISISKSHLGIKELCSSACHDTEMTHCRLEKESGFQFGRIGNILVDFDQGKLMEHISEGKFEQILHQKH